MLCSSPVTHGVLGLENGTTVPTHRFQEQSPCPEQRRRKGWKRKALQMILNSFLLRPLERNPAVLSPCFLFAEFLLTVGSFVCQNHNKGRPWVSTQAIFSLSRLWSSHKGIIVAGSLGLSAPEAHQRHFLMPAWPHRSLSHCIKLNSMINLCSPQGPLVHTERENIYFYQNTSIIYFHFIALIKKRNS